MVRGTEAWRTISRYCKVAQNDVRYDFALVHLDEPENKDMDIVIFGASGDLTSRKLVPALYHLFVKGRLPADARIVGVARSPFRDEQFRDHLLQAWRQDDGKEPIDRWNEFAERIFYVAGDASKTDGLDALDAWLKEKEGSGGPRLYYLALGPDLVPQIVSRLAEKGMIRDKPGDPNAQRRLVVEKPFGRDLASARELNRILHAHLREDQIFRIDHYLGKETVQNVLVFRFANTLFEPLWNFNFIDSVQITVAESVTVGSRGPFYDQTGVLRDMFQSHLLQMLTLVTMEAASRYAADPLRNEKVKLLDAVRVYAVEEASQNIVCGQYAGYRKERGVAADLRTPTFAAVRLFIDNWRWRGVPFYLRSGKGLTQRISEVVIQFHCPPHLMFPMPPGRMLQCNRLSICIQPDEGMHLNFQSKVPDQEGMELRPTDMEFHYRDAYGDGSLPEAYEVLLEDALKGDAALFMRSDEIERAWQIMDPLIAATERADAPAPEEYAVGSNGPANADAFLARDGRQWVLTCRPH